MSRGGEFRLCSGCGQWAIWTPLTRRRPVYCCEACAFEASKKKGAICGSRESLETSLKFLRSSEKK